MAVNDCFGDCLFLDGNVLDVKLDDTYNKCGIVCNENGLNTSVCYDQDFRSTGFVVRSGNIPISGAYEATPSGNGNDTQVCIQNRAECDIGMYINAEIDATWQIEQNTQVNCSGVQTTRSHVEFELGWRASVHPIGLSPQWTAWQFDNRDVWKYESCGNQMFSDSTHKRLYHNGQQDAARQLIIRPGEEYCMQSMLRTRVITATTGDLSRNEFISYSLDNHVYGLAAPKCDGQ